MAKEYGELEQLVNDVTSLDTARMTLRWALERLNTIEKDKADLKKNLTIAEETAKKLQLKDSALTDAYSSRSKTLEEKEDFYTKLEATMSLLGEGKLDIQQLLKKEAKLDSLRKDLENEYQDKFEDLDRNQRSVIERWNARLLEVESQYAGRLAEAQQKYDGLRAELESGYQGRMSSLQASFKARETELAGQIQLLEGNLHSAEGKLEGRRADLEKEHLLKQRENEENYRKLKSMLETGFDEKLRSMDCDHAAQVRSLEASWQTERARLLEEQRVREDQFTAAQARIQQIENSLATQQEKHHGEILRIISEKENAFRAQVVELEKEKVLKEETVKELVSRLEKKASDWEAERSRLEAEFGRRLAGADAAMHERVSEAERDYAAKKEELAQMLTAGREKFAREFQARLGMERAAMEEEKSRLAAERQLREEALAKNAEKVAELEAALAAGREEHHKELMERIRAGELSFREKLAAFEAEKRSYNESLNNLTGELRRKDAAVIEEKKKIAAEFEAKLAIHGEMAARTEAAFEEKRLAYEGKVAELSARLEDAAKASALEKENFKGEIARVYNEVQALAEERTAGIRADYEARKADLEKEFAARYSDRLKALEAERARVNEALAEREIQLEASHTHAAELDAAIAELRMSVTDEKAALSREYSAEMNRALKAAEEAAKAREAELSADVNVLRAELTERDRLLSLEREKLVDELSKASVEAHNRTEERAAAVRADYERRLADQEALAENNTRELKALLAEKETLLEKAAADRADAEKAVKALFDIEKMKWVEEKEALAEKFDRSVAELEAGLLDRTAGIRADYEARKADLEKDFAARYGDRLKALEAEKARVNEALAEREIQLDAAHARGAELDAAIAELRRSSSEEKAALSREYSAEMNRALKAAEEAAKAREAELSSDVDVLRAELTERDRLLSLEREKLVDELSKASVEAHNRTEERAAAVRAEYEKRLVSLEAAAESRLQEIKELLGEKETLLEKALQDRVEAEKAVKAIFEVEKVKWIEEKEALAEKFDRSVAELEAGLLDRTAGIRADYEARKADLEKDFAARYGDRLKALEAEKARVNEALAEREIQLDAAHARGAELDAAIAELRRSSSEEKAALSREYSAEMNRALKAAEEAAKAREAELSSDVDVLRAELTERDRLLSLEREKLVDELSKASVEAHNRTEERAAAVRADYERRLADQEALAGNNTRELKALLAEKETLLEKAAADRAEAEKALRADFESRTMELEAGLSAKTAALEADYAGRREKLEADAAARAAAVNAEAAAKMDFERGNWQAERARFESTLAETSGHFRAAQKEIEGLNAGLREAAEAGAAHEAAFSRELMEAKATYDRELAYRVKDAVTVQTAHLVEALEASKARQEELAATLEDKDNSIRALRAEAAAARRDYEEGLLSAGGEAVAAKRQELEQLYVARKQELEKEFASLRGNLQNAYESREKEMSRQLELNVAQFEAKNRSLSSGMEQLRAQAEAANAKATEVFNAMMQASKKHQEELFRVKEEHAGEIDIKIAASVEAATRALAGKLAAAEAGFAKEREDHKNETAALEKFFGETREKLAAELENAKNYSEVLDFKIQDMEKELVKTRQNSAAEFLSRITDQDQQIASLEGKYKARQEKLESETRQKMADLTAAYDAKVRAMEELVKGKEQLIRDSEDFWGKKQAEVDKAHADFNLRVSKFNEELFAQKQALGEKENSLNDYRLKLERDYASRNAETEKMKAELTRAILDYKSRK